MELRLIKENIRLESCTGAGQSQAVVEGEIALPGGLREEARVLACMAMAVPQSAEAQQDRAMMSGRVVFHVLYTQGDPDKVQSIEATADYTHMMELPGAQPRMICQAEATVEHAEAAAHSGRLSLKAVVRTAARAVSRQGVEAVTGIQGVAGLQIKPSQLQVRRTVAQGAGEMLLREEFDLPSSLKIRETLCASASARVTGVTGGIGRLGLEGIVRLEVYHAADLPGQPVVVTRHTIPFERAVDLSGEDGDVPQGRAIVCDVAVASQESGDGERLLRAEVLLDVQGWTDRMEQITLPTDAYTTVGDDLRLSTQQAVYRVNERAVHAAESGRVMLSLPADAPPARQMLCAFASPVMTSAEQLGGRLTTEGMMEITLVYMTDDSGAPVSVSVEEPFRMTFAAQSGEGDFLALSVEEAEASVITGDRVELKYIMHLDGRGAETEQATLVTGAESAAAPELPGGVVLCFAQPGETLWDISRRYRVAAQDVRRLNPNLQGEPAAGQGVVIWRK